MPRIEVGDRVGDRVVIEVVGAGPGKRFVLGCDRGHVTEVGSSAVRKVRARSSRCADCDLEDYRRTLPSVGDVIGIWEIVYGPVSVRNSTGRMYFVRCTRCGIAPEIPRATANLRQNVEFVRCRGCRSKEFLGDDLVDTKEIARANGVKHVAILRRMRGGMTFEAALAETVSARVELERRRIRRCDVCGRECQPSEFGRSPRRGTRVACRNCLDSGLTSRGRRDVLGVRMTCAEAAEIFGVSEGRIRHRLGGGMTLADAIRSIGPIGQIGPIPPDGTEEF